MLRRLAVGAHGRPTRGCSPRHQLAEFYPDLSDERFDSGLALVHSRFSTNTFPSWPLAHPYRYLAHNGEINTLAREPQLDAGPRGAAAPATSSPGPRAAVPHRDPDGSDSASFDEVLELLAPRGAVAAPRRAHDDPRGVGEPHAPWTRPRRAFYRYHASLMEPWDGPAAVVFTDGTVVGAVLDRNGLRPGAVLGDRRRPGGAGQRRSGVLDIDPAKVVRKGRLQPGRMFLVDTAQGRIVDDDEIKARLAAAHPYGQWLEEGQVDLDDLPPRVMLTPQHASVVDPPAAVRLHQRGAPPHRGARWPRPAAEPHRLDGQRRGHRRAERAVAPALRLLHPALRPGDQPAARRHPRGAGHLGALQARARGEPARAAGRLVPPDHPAVPGDRQRRAGQAGST